MTTIWGFLLQTISISFVALFLLLLKWLFEDKLSPRWQYAIWSILAVRILFPVTMQRQIFLPMPIIMETLKTMAEQTLSSVYIKPYEPITINHVFPIIQATALIFLCKPSKSYALPSFLSLPHHSTSLFPNYKFLVFLMLAG